MKITMIIPSLNPSNKILEVISELCDIGFSEIIVVNDGSDASKQPLFDTIALLEQCTLLVHPQNLGKGKALKTAMQYYIENNLDSKGVVTCDDDGQHCLEDILHCANSVLAHEDSLVLGVRSFESENVPLKSQIGNQLTKWYMERICKIRVSDTQTGLRGIPNAIIPVLIETTGDRFEYEINMLLETNRQGIPMIEVPISTVYIEDNRATRFRPVIDSFQIYLKLAKFSFSSLSSFFVDIICFMLLCKLFEHCDAVTKVFLATFFSRVISSTVNYTVNKQFVFGNNNSIYKSATKYYALCILQMFISFLMVVFFTAFLSDTYLIPLKVMVDFFLFLLGFNLQKNWVFRR